MEAPKHRGEQHRKEKRDLRGVTRGDIAFLAGMVGATPLVGCVITPEVSKVAQESKKDEEKVDRTEHITHDVTAFEDQLKEVIEASPSFTSKDKGGSTVMLRERVFNRNNQSYILARMETSLESKYQAFGDKGGTWLWILVANPEKHYLTATKFGVPQPPEGKVTKNIMNVLMPDGSDNYVVITGSSMLHEETIDQVPQDDAHVLNKFISLKGAIAVITSWGLTDSQKKPDTLSNLMYQPGVLNDPTTHAFLRKSDGTYVEDISFGEKK